jgi:tetratricopeptide (TPR) repeat protein
MRTFFAQGSVKVTFMYLAHGFKVFLCVSIVSASWISKSIAASNEQAAMEAAVQYWQSIKDLNDLFEAHWKNGSKLIAEQEATKRRMEETRQKFEQLMGEKAIIAMRSLESQLVIADTQTQIDKALEEQAKKVPDQLVGDVRLSPYDRLALQTGATFQDEEFKTKVGALARQQNMERIFNDLNLHQGKSLDVAESLIVQRHMSQVKDLQRGIEEQFEWQKKLHGFFDRYWDLADITQIRSDLELRKGLEQTNDIISNNPGQLFLKAVLLNRLQRYDEAIKVIDASIEIPRLRLLLVCLKAEILMRTDKPQEAITLLRQIPKNALADSRIRMQRATAYAAGKMYKQAIDDWEVIGKSGEHGIDAKRTLACLYVTFDNNRSKVQAIKNGELAVKLNSEDWSCSIAMAMAYAKGEKKEKAIEFANRAIEQSLGSNREFCEIVATKIENEESVYWRF